MQHLEGEKHKPKFEFRTLILTNLCRPSSVVESVAVLKVLRQVLVGRLGQLGHEQGDGQRGRAQQDHRQRLPVDGQVAHERAAQAEEPRAPRAYSDGLTKEICQ